MADHEINRQATHPYAETSPETHGHFLPTELRYPPYSAGAVPYAWMFKESLERYAQEYGIDVNPEREPELKFSTPWVQEGQNQRGLLDCFFGHTQPELSLCFFYVKQMPMIEDPRRVIVGVGRVKHVGQATEYRRKDQTGIDGYLWERMVQHSIRPGFPDGFLLPYPAILALAEQQADFDPVQAMAFAPADRHLDFSYGTEHVTHGGAISSLLSVAQALSYCRGRISGDIEAMLDWTDRELARLWRMRGPCPGLASVLGAMGLSSAAMVAMAIQDRAGENENPWPHVDAMFRNPHSILPAELSRLVGPELAALWANLPGERKELADLVSRFDITPEQAAMIYVQEVRRKAGVDLGDHAILDNPYLLYELTRLEAQPISLPTVDQGIYPESIVREQHPLPIPRQVNTPTDVRRVRAFTIAELEQSATLGDTLAPRDRIVMAIREAAVAPSCPVTGDLMEVAEEDFEGVVVRRDLADGSPAYQLGRLFEMDEIIRRVVERRRSAMRHEVAADWAALLDRKLGPSNADLERRARQEKAAVLAELAASRLSVLIGPAGTGKTLVLALLCSNLAIEAEGVLLLAPTGKARVRIEEETKRTGHPVKGLTVAQHLSKSRRYDGQTGRYRRSDLPANTKAGTVIVDESSMLTEEMLGALLDSLSGVQRLILVGDPRQLPPIGAGRPFLDIVNHLVPSDLASRFPKVGNGYCELTVRRRQTGADRADLELANWFSGGVLEAGDDQILMELAAGDDPKHLRLRRWDTPEELRGLLQTTLVEELGLAGPGDRQKFDCSLGGKIDGQYSYFNNGSGAQAEAWQILSPVKGSSAGTSELNRLIHKQYRKFTVEHARTRFRKIPRPFGSQEIVYGDKVINLRNHARKYVWPEEGALAYVANGEIGVAIGQFKTKRMRSAPRQLQIEFSSQPGHRYSYWPSDFSDEGDPALELAYALTIHKAQGSQFGTVILILPNPCRLLSRELLYTALTRQQDRVVLLHQGEFADFRSLASDAYSETAKRLTCLFRAASPTLVAGRMYEESLIHKTSRGELVRSKSEVIVADRLAARGIEYIYERPLELGGETRYPDFTIEDQDTGITYYWEHCGMLQDATYRQRWERKKAWYEANGIPIWDESLPEATRRLIISEDGPNGSISSQDIEQLIRRALL